MKVTAVTLSLYAALCSVFAVPANAQSYAISDPAILNLPKPTPFPDPNIVCGYAELNFSSVVSAIKSSDDYTNFTLWQAADSQVIKVEVLTYYLAYLGEAALEVRFLSACLKNQRVTLSPPPSVTEPSGTTPPQENVLFSGSPMSAPDNDGDSADYIQQYFPVLNGPAKAATQAAFLDALTNRYYEMISNYSKVYGYVYHPSELTTNGAGVKLKHPDLY